MTDEELGRRWCAANARRPDHEPGGEPYHPHYRWWTHDDPSAGPAGLPRPLWPAVNGYSTEAEAYAAVGSTLREVWAFVDASRRDVQP